MALYWSLSFQGFSYRHFCKSVLTVPKSERRWVLPAVVEFLTWLYLYWSGKVRKVLWFRTRSAQLCYHILWSYILQARSDRLTDKFLFGWRLQCCFFNDFQEAYFHVPLNRQAAGKTSAPEVKFMPLKWSQSVSCLQVS